MKESSALGGLAGACTLTLLHEIIRRIDPEAPRMDLLGMNAISKTLKKTHSKVPDEGSLFGWTMAGDLLSNSLYYSAVGAENKKEVWLRGAVLGLGAGIGAVLLPKPLGLNEAPSNRTTKTKVLTVALYLIGGLVASFTVNLLEGRRK